MENTQYTYSIVIFDHGAPSLISALQAVLTALQKENILDFEIFLFYYNTKFSLSIDDVLVKFSDIKVIGVPEKTNKIDIYNYAIQRTKGKLLIFLNSNIKINENFFSVLKPYKDKKNLFSLTPKLDSISFSHFGKNCVYDDLYFIKASHQSPSFLSLNGIAIYKRNVLLQINGFDNNYNFCGYTFWCDADVHLKAWTQGYGTLYDPQLELFFVELNSLKSFYTPVIDFYSSPNVLQKIIWNSNRTMFFLRHHPTILKTILWQDIKKINILGIISFLFGIIRGIMKKKEFLKPIYSYDKIISIVEKEAL